MKLCVCQTAQMHLKINDRHTFMLKSYELITNMNSLHAIFESNHTYLLNDLLIWLLKMQLCNLRNKAHFEMIQIDNSYFKM